MKKHVTHIGETEDGMTYTVDIEPLDGTELIQQVGNRLVVAYLAQDYDPPNPMTDYDGQGTLYTKPQRRGGGSITDDSSWGSYLGLTEDGEHDLELDAVAEGCFQWFKAGFPEAKIVEWMLKYDESPEAVIDSAYGYWAPDQNGFDLVDEDEAWIAGYADGLPKYDVVAERIWAELYDAGKIGAFLAVPVDYTSNNHGPGTTSGYVTTVDNCNAVWVPDQDCIDNMAFTPKDVEITQRMNLPGNNKWTVAIKGIHEAQFDTFWEAIAHVKANFAEPDYTDKLKAARKYAEGIIEEYINWCNGEVYGCVVYTFTKGDGEWVQESEDACWGFIGSEYAEYAEKTLDEEYFRYAIEAAKKLNSEEAEKEAEDIRTQCGLQIEMEI